MLAGFRRTGSLPARCDNVPVVWDSVSHRADSDWRRAAVRVVHDRAMGDQLELRPPREDDLAIIEKLTQDPEITGEFAWFGWHDPLRWRRGWDENRLLGDVGG